jgi:hypothetical protein
MVSLLGLLMAVVIWVGIFVAIAPIAGALSLPLLLTALLVALVPALLGLALGRLLRVKAGEKSSLATAIELVSVRHPWYERVGKLMAPAGALAVLVVLLGGLVVLILDPSDREAIMFRIVFGTFFVVGLPFVIYRALLMAVPVLDDNSRDSFLAGGFSGIILQVLALSLLLSSLSAPHAWHPFGISTKTLLPVSLPFVLIPLVYFLLTTAVPYAIGVRSSRRLTGSFLADEQGITEALENLLLLPKAQIYGDALEGLNGEVEDRIATLKDEFFYLQLRAESSVQTTERLARAIETGQIGVAAGAEARDPASGVRGLSAGAVAISPVVRPTFVPELALSGTGGVSSGEIIEGTDAPRAVAADDEADDDAGTSVADDGRTYGELIQLVAEEQGWSTSDYRRRSLEYLADSFENEARYADPSFIHCGWLERVGRLISEIQSDLAGRDSTTDMESAALSWSPGSACDFRMTRTLPGGDA